MRVFAILILLSTLCIAVTSQTRINLTPCEVPGTAPEKKAKVLCGSLEVYEDRAKRRGRKISLAIHVYPATGSTKFPDPLFYIPGGPGSSARDDAPWVAEDMAKVRETRDLIFLDQRGTGGSNPLVCELFDAKDVHSYLTHWNPPARVRECRKQLEQRANLGLYNTEPAMDDLDDVRSALGLEKINLLGASYGTRAVLTYIKRHGGRVRSAMLHGVAPPDQFMPRDFPLQTESALNGLFDECLADAACKAAFPNVRDDAQRVLATLKKGSVEVDVEAPPDGRKLKVRLSRDLAGEAIRYMLYHTGRASRIPLVLSLAATGNYAPLAEAAIFYRQRIVATDATGLYLSITCAEDLPSIRETLSQRAHLDNTFLGDYRLREMREACAEWPRGAVSADYASPVRSDVPVLITTGALDPVTPPLYGDRVVKNFPNSLHVVVPSGGHGFNGLTNVECVTELMADFIRTAAPRSIDTSCVKSMRRKGFVLKLSE